MQIKDLSIAIIKRVNCFWHTGEFHIHTTVKQIFPDIKNKTLLSPHLEQ